MKAEDRLQPPSEGHGFPARQKKSALFILFLETVLFQVQKGVALSQLPHSLRSALALLDGWMLEVNVGLVSSLTAEEQRSGGPCCHQGNLVNQRKMCIPF